MENAILSQAGQGNPFEGALSFRVELTLLLA
jgi:hypothetical protein